MKLGYKWGFRIVPKKSQELGLYVLLLNTAQENFQNWVLLNIEGNEYQYQVQGTR